MFRGLRAVLRTPRCDPIPMEVTTVAPEPSPPEPTNEEPDDCDGMTDDTRHVVEFAVGTPSDAGSASIVSIPDSDTSEISCPHIPWTIFHPRSVHLGTDEENYGFGLPEKRASLDFRFDDEGSVRYTDLCRALMDKKNIPYSSRVVLDVKSIYVTGRSIKHHSYVCLIRNLARKPVMGEKYESLDTYGNEKMSFFTRSFDPSEMCRLTWEARGFEDAEMPPIFTTKFFEIISTSCTHVRNTCRVDIRYRVRPATQ